MEQKPVKDIDFLPEWYKAGRKRKGSYKRQYTAITSLFAILVAWSFVVDHSASVASAKIGKRNAFMIINQSLKTEHGQIQTELDRFKDKAELLEKLSPRVNFANVIAELSFTVNQNIMISTLDMTSEQIDATSDSTRSIVRINPQGNNIDETMPLENSRFRVTITGIAADASDVALLISKLESSPYFCNVIPGFSKTKEISEYLVTEFQIDCFVANYICQK